MRERTMSCRCDAVANYRCIVLTLVGLSAKRGVTMGKWCLVACVMAAVVFSASLLSASLSSSSSSSEKLPPLSVEGELLAPVYKFTRTIYSRRRYCGKTQVSARLYCLLFWRTCFYGCPGGVYMYVPVCDWTPTALTWLYS